MSCPGPDIAYSGAPLLPAPPLPDHRRRKPGRPPQWSGCQVCGADVSGCRSFHKRYHICVEHMAAESILRNGVPHRFCQQCGRFHVLDRFAPGLHSCREQLARHAERRRRTHALAAARKAGPRGRAAPARPTDDQAANPCGTTAAAALHAKRPHSAPADPTAAAPSDQHASPVRSPGCQDAPPRLQGGLSGSSESTHSIHFAQGAEAEETAGHRTAAGSPSFSCDGMDALLAAAAEQEEAEAEGPAAKRPRPIASLHPTASALVLPLQRSVALSLEPDPTWFAALAERTAARTATAALRLVAVQQAQQLHEAHRAAQAHRELLAAREREQQELQHAQHVAGLFKAIAEGLAALCAGAATPGQPLTR
ncbi:hypothetical protein ABPG77_010133 [Micractinium sp. CCAP 211/92]